MSLVRRRDEKSLFPEWPDWLNRMVDWREGFDELLKVEEYREDGTVVIRAELPGIDPDKDVDITVADDTVTITAERREETKAEDRGRYHSEFHYGSFTRVLPLAPGTKQDDVTATYKDGILEIRLPVDEEKGAVKKIEITKA